MTKFLAALRTRRSRGSARDTLAETSASDRPELPISGYDRLEAREIADQLSQLSQVELATVEAYERAHEGRPVVLHKLRYMRGREPVSGYDVLTPEQIVKTLARADSETVKAVRDYERKFHHRQSVLNETARVLPTSRASVGEERAREQKARAPA